MKTNITSALHRFKTRLLAWAIPAALCITMAQAQTILVNPATDGGFEMGTGSLADNGWTAVSNGTSNPKDRWFTGSGKTNGAYSFPSNTRCAYIDSSVAGTSWAAATSSGISNVPHMYKTVTVAAGQTNVVLSFKYTQKGASNVKLMVYVCDDAMIPNSSDPQSNGGAISATGWGTGNVLLMFSAATPLPAGTQTFTAQIPPSFLNNCSSSKTFKLVFSAYKGLTSNNDPPPAVDSVSVISSVPTSASPGIFTINNSLPTSGSNFKSFTDAINWVNAVSACGLSNAITFNVSAGQTFNENTPYITASGTATKQIIFQKSGAGANPVIRPTGEFGAYIPTTSNPGTQDYGICLHGADYVTFDGIDIVSNNFAPAANATSVSVEYGYLVRNASGTNGATNNTIKNTTIILDKTTYGFNGTAPATKGIVQSCNTIGGGFTASNQSGTNDNNSYLNFTIGNVNNGVLIYGTSATSAFLPDRNTKISTLTPGTFNYIGRDGVANDIGNNNNIIYGINLNYQYDAIVNNNIVQNLTSTSTSANNMIDGILIGFTNISFASAGSGGINNEVANNQVRFIKSTNATTAVPVTGMRIQHDNQGTLGTMGFRIYNNVISNLTSNYTGTPNASRTTRGLFLQTAAPTNNASVQYEIVNNTIVIDGSASPGLSNICFEQTYGSSVLKMRNNLFFNATGPQTTATHCVLGITGTSTAIGTTGSLSNYNDFYYSDPTGGILSYNNNMLTLASWQLNFGVDANSISANPKLNSATVLYPLSSSPLIGGGPTLSPPYNRDIMGTLRASGNSTIGAIEKVGDVVSPVISDTTILGINSTSNRTLLGLLNVIDDGGMVANTAGTAPRIYFKKSTEANAFGANTPGFNGWKWVEATNTSSPFDFTINYALLTSAVNVHDVIQYFFVVQDTVSTPNIAALPSAGFIGTSVSSITSAPTTPKSYVIYNTPAAYVTSAAIQANTSKTVQNSTNNAILRIAVQTGPTGDSAYVTQMTFNSSATTDLSNIASAKVWYTGTSANFDAYNTANKQFGRTYTTPAGSGALGTFAFNGGQITPPNSTVYFWLTYDIKASAAITDSVDAEVVSLVYNGTPEFPSATNPTGARGIKQSYCVPGLSGNRHLSVVSFNTLNNNAGASSFLPPYYVNYIPTGTATTILKRGLTYTMSVTQTTGSTSIVVYIDYNDNGIFEANEATTVSPFAGAAGTVSTMPISIPCNAVPSTEVRMRIIAYTTGSPWADACTQASASEVQDYTLTIVDAPAEYVSSSATQYSGNVAPLTTNKVMMRLPIVTQGCGTGYLTQVYCNTAKTMNPGTNIMVAKLYSTGTSNAFTTAELLASVASPIGSFTFTAFSDSLYSNKGDTNNYWIVYDMAAAAALNDTIDVRIDSITVSGQYFVPGNNNPVQYSLVKALNTYSNSDVIHANNTRIPRPGQLYTPALRIRIVGSSTGAPIQLSQLNFDPAGGGNDTLNIKAARVFYTGNNATFNATTQFGNTYTAGGNITGNKWNTFSIAGVQDLNFDTNYFWLAYDMNANASTTDSVDADLSSLIVAGVTYTPTKSLTGALNIKPNYCFMGPSGGGFSSQTPSTWYEDITNVTFGTINNSSTCSQTGGVGSILGQYSDYSDIVAPADVLVGDTVRFTLAGVGNCNQASANTQSMGFVIMIDWNQNGIFEASELAYKSAVSQATRTYTDKLFVPCSALPGYTRMRVIYGTGSNATNAALLGPNCGNTSTTVYVYGETEDYTLNVVNNPTATIRTSFVQVTGAIGKGVSDVPVMRVAIKPKGCGALLTKMNFSYSGNTLADITAAKLYTTGNSTVFNTNTLVGSVAPSANIEFNGLSSAFTNNALTDSTYFWLAYDVASSAVTTDTLDAKVDSITVGGIMYNTVATGNPASNRTIAARMAYAGSTVVQPDTASVAVGTANKIILRVNVAGNNTNGPVPITNLTFNVNGSGNNLLNVDSARVYYTTTTTFSTATPFGAAYSPAPSPWGAFTFSGTVNTSSVTNYFWLVYDIKTTATVYDSVDAELVSVTFDGVPQTYTLGASQGNSKIRGDYCQTTHQGTANGAYNILTSVTIGGTTTSGTTRVPPFYINNTTTALRNLTKGPNTMSITARDLPNGTGSYAHVYIDFDQNGDFSGVNEFVGSITTPYDVNVTLPFTIPCDVKSGITRMRVTASMSATPPALCGLSATYGETEDYLVNIQNSPLTYSMSTATQSTGTVMQGGSNQLIMGIKVRATGCGAPMVSNMYFNTVGSTNPGADIVEAKLYKTGTNTIFNTANLIASAPAPNGQFSFALTNDTLALGNDTTYYWLTYDISPSATNTNIVDARFDSLIVLGVKQIPTVTTPTPVKTVLAPMTILSASASHTSPDRISIGSTNFQAIRVRVITSAGATLPVTSINFNTVGGGIDVNNITSARVYYTGSNKDFVTTAPFGSMYTAGANTAGGKWLAFTVSGYQELLPDTNYFWLTYNLKTTATVGDSVDAEAPSMMIGGVSQTITPSAPSGNSILRQEYCIPGNVNQFGCIDTVRMGGTLESFSVGTCVNYTNYPSSPTKTASAYAGSSFPISASFSSPQRASVFIDLNRNGVFETGEEFNIAPSHVQNISTSIIIPSNALQGETRLRFRTFGGQSSSGTDRACSNWNQSETEDYTITILPALPQTTYTWNNAGTSDFTLASNWIPARNAASNTDNLVFNSNTAPLNITNVFTQTVSSIEVTQGTIVNLNATSSAEIQVSGSTILQDSAKINGNNNIMITIGESTGAVGSLTVGNASGINAKMKRWVGFVNSGNIVFPFISAKGTRSLNISYTYAPTSYGSITASFVPTRALGNFGLPLYESGIGSDVTKTCAEGYWSTEAGNGLAGGAYLGIFTIDSMMGVTNPYAITAINRPDAFSPWVLNGSHNASSINGTAISVYRSVIQGYGQFAFAADSTQNQLPVTLVSFAGKANGYNALLQWTTASEVNNKGFELERSVDGKSFEQVTFVKGNGTTTKISNYNYNDANAFALNPVLYYRLKQVDVDGSFTYSSIVRVTSNMQKASTANVFPNPFTNSYQVALNVQNDATVTMIMTDIQGRTVANETVFASKGNNTLSINNMASLEAGVYFLKVTVDGETQIIKMIKN